MIDTGLVVGEFVFHERHDRASYLGMSKADRLQWLEENRGKWQRIEDMQQGLAPMAGPLGNIILPATTPAPLSSSNNGSSSSKVLVAEEDEAPAPKADRCTRRERLSATAHDYHDKAKWVPLCLKGKQPTGKAWQKRTLADPIPGFEEDSNIGILLGEPSGGLVRLDYDLPQVPGVHEELFPPAPVFGRKSAPATGRLVVCKGLKTTNFILPKSMIDDPRLSAHGENERNLVVLQILSTGAQTMAPPSIHPTAKEEVQWEELPSEIPRSRPPSFCTSLASRRR